MQWRNSSAGEADVSACGPAAQENGANKLEWCLFAAYALALAFVVMHHEMWRDELQAWVIARDSHTIGGLFRNLRYEGHPVCWYLLLFGVSRFTWNPVAMQAVQCLVACAQAWMIVRARRVPIVLRGLIIFSYFFFYQYGVMARSYMLSSLFLVGAALCLLTHTARRKTAVLLLALAINTHLLAIPVAAAIFFLLYVPHASTERSVKAAVHRRENWMAAAVLGLSLAVAGFTVYPPADSAVHHGVHIYNFTQTLASVWTAYLPLPFRMYGWEGPLGVWRAGGLCLASVLALAAIAAALHNRGARLFYGAATVLELAAIGTLTINAAGPTQSRFLGFLFVVLVITICMEFESEERRIPQAGSGARAGTVPLALLLAAQLPFCLASAVADVQHPYTEAKAASQWLREAGLGSNPMVVDPESFSAGIVGYLQRPSVFHPSCECQRSFVILNQQHFNAGPLTREMLLAARGNSDRAVILVSEQPRDAAECTRLGLRELRRFENHPIKPEEIFFIYEVSGDGMERPPN
jgi:hypothetical protein